MSSRTRHGAQERTHADAGARHIGGNTSDTTHSALHAFTSSGFARMIAFVHAFRMDGNAGGTAICSAEKMRCSMVCAKSKGQGQMG